jgi:hypothetical protein
MKGEAVIRRTVTESVQINVKLGEAPDERMLGLTVEITAGAEALDGTDVNKLAVQGKDAFGDRVLSHILPLAEYLKDRGIKSIADGGHDCFREMGVGVPPRRVRSGDSSRRALG